MVRLPTETEKPPSNLIRTASGVVEVSFLSDRVLVSSRRFATFVTPTNDNNSKDGNSAIPYSL